MNEKHRQRLTDRTIDPLTAVGALLMLIGITALVTYMALIQPGKQRAAEGPPQEFIEAATRQAVSGDGSAPVGYEDPSADVTFEIPPTIEGTRQIRGGSIAPPQPTVNPFGDWPLPDYVEQTYWISVPAIGLEAPVIALAPRRFDNGVTRIPVPNSFSVAWDTSSAEPGFQGNTVLTGHNNLYGAVFGDLSNIPVGAQVSVWSDYGVFTYTVSSAQLVEEEALSFAERKRNAEIWLGDTFEDRLTLITCGPGKDDTHRFIVVATR